MRTKEFTFTADHFHLLWKALHDREEKLNAIIETSEDDDSDEFVFVSNDIDYLRGFMRWFEKEGRTVFNDSVFDLSEEAIKP